MRLRRNEIELLLSHRAIGPRLLAAVGGAQDVVADVIEQQVDLAARRLDLVHERAGERAVAAAVLVERDIALFGGVDDERARRLFRRRREAAIEAAAGADAPVHASLERIV